LPLIDDAYFTFATVRIDASFCSANDTCHFQPSFAQYALLPGQNKKLIGKPKLKMVLAPTAKRKYKIIGVFYHLYNASHYILGQKTE
jgi:hypothetical protein